MTEEDLRAMSIPELLKLADEAVSMYVTFSGDPKHIRLAEQRQLELALIQKVIIEKRANE